MRRPLLTCLSAGLAASAFALSLGGCAGAPLSVSGRESPEREVPQQSIDQDTGIFDTSTPDLEFSDRDKDAAYDEATATKVMLSDEGIQIEGAGAVAKGGRGHARPERDVRCFGVSLSGADGGGCSR